MFIVKNKKIFLTISAVLVGLSLVSIAYFGLNLGIDFKGGAQLEVIYAGTVPSASEVQQNLANSKFSGALLQATDNGYIVKTHDLSEVDHNELVSVMGKEASEKSFVSIGPSVGHELVRKSIILFVLVSLGIIFFIAFSFRKVSKPISSWKYGIIAIVTLIHDVLIPVGVFAAVSHFYGTEVDTLFVVAILTILGLSVSDTIVVFDRIRENLRHAGHSFAETVGKSLDQVYTRSIMTSLTVIIALLALVFFGPESTKVFAIMLVAGMFFGTYSSIFLASPMLVALSKHK